MNDPVTRIVEVCVFRFAVDRAEYLVLQRMHDDPLHPRLWQLITGTIEKGETGAQTALREFVEETGMKPRRFWRVPHASVFYDPQYDAVHLCPLFAVQVEAGDEVRLSAEHARYLWLPRTEAVKWLIFPGHREGVECVEEYIVKGEAAAGFLEMPL